MIQISKNNFLSKTVLNLTIPFSLIFIFNSCMCSAKNVVGSWNVVKGRYDPLKVMKCPSDAVDVFYIVKKKEIIYYFC